MKYLQTRLKFVLYLITIIMFTVLFIGCTHEKKQYEIEYSSKRQYRIEEKQHKQQIHKEKIVKINTQKGKSDILL